MSISKHHPDQWSHIPARQTFPFHCSEMASFSTTIMRIIKLIPLLVHQTNYLLIVSGIHICMQRWLGLLNEQGPLNPTRPRRACHLLSYHTTCCFPSSLWCCSDKLLFQLIVLFFPSFCSAPSSFLTERCVALGIEHLF